jgi:NTE family protein
MALFKKKFGTGLVLSGGGTRGFAHLGVCKALKEAGVEPDIIAGVSAGSIAGSLIADGKDPEEALHLLAGHRLLDYLEFTIPKKGLVSMGGFEKTLKTCLTARRFEDLRIPLLVFAVNMNKAELTLFDKGELIPAIKASSSIPVVFQPVRIGDQDYLDGGIIDNFPTQSLKGKCKTLIGVNVNPIGPVDKLGNLKNIAERTFHISVRFQATNKEDDCDIYIEPAGLDRYGLLDVSRAAEIFELGYIETREVLKKSGFGG